MVAQQQRRNVAVFCDLGSRRPVFCRTVEEAQQWLETQPQLIRESAFIGVSEDGITFDPFEDGKGQTITIRRKSSASIPAPKGNPGTMSPRGAATLGAHEAWLAKRRLEDEQHTL